MFAYQRILLIFLTVSTLLGSFSSIASTHEEKPSKTIQEKKAYDMSVVDINTATAEDLMRLKGIGKKRAQAVLADREQNGKFNRIEDLSRVKGLSEKHVSRIMSQNQGRIQAGK